MFVDVWPKNMFSVRFLFANIVFRDCFLAKNKIFCAGYWMKNMTLGMVFDRKRIFRDDPGIILGPSRDHFEVI